MKNDIFAEHGIKHLSVSSCNTFITDPARWVAKYLFGMKTKSGPAAWRGTVVDEATGIYLKSEKPNLKKCTDLAMRRFKGLTEHNKVDPHDDKCSKERHLVPQYLKTAIEFYETLGMPKEYQKEILLDVGMSVPMLGYIDLQYDGIVRDIKTVGRIPSEVPNTVKRQLSLYAKAEDSLPIVDYICVTTRKQEVKSVVVEDTDSHFEDLMRSARAIERVLQLGDKNEIAQLYFPNLDSWMWTDEEKEFAKTIWSNNE